MNPQQISETIRRSIEERRRRRKEQAAAVRQAEAPAEKEPASAPSDPLQAPPDVAACAAQLQDTVRESILSSFTQWEVTLIPQIEGVVRQAALHGGDAADRSPGTPAGPGWADGGAAPPGSEAGMAPGGGGPPPPAEGADSPPDRDSWETLAEAVRELRQEWDRETFESRFGDLAPPAPAPTEIIEPEEELSPHGAPGEAVSPAAGGSASQVFASGNAAPPSTTAAPAELARKLDELIQLVKRSISTSPADRQPIVPPELTREIAREIAGRLRSTMGTAAPPGPPPPAAPPAAPNRIPLDDVASMIDQITGSKPT